LRVALAILGAVGLLVAVAGTAHGESSAPTRVDDRTVVCVTQIVAGVRKFNASFSPRIPPADTLPEGLAASASVSSGLFGSRDAALVSISGGPKAQARVSVGPRCTRTRANVPLSTKGLPGPPVRFQSDVACALPGRILVRARVVSEGGRVTRAELAVRMEKSVVPVAYALIDRDGDGVFYSSPRCG
jgi:hypothetical protein